ncbi:MAG: outer membrane protein [Candidatus Methylomirabilales bacterium]
MRKQTFVVAACIAALVIPTLSWAEDTDQTRFYVGVKLGAPFWLSDPTEQVSARSATEPTFNVVGGLNFGKHFGVELAYDYMETELEFGGVGKIGEYSLWTLIPQLRVRYPLDDGKWSPYFIGGVGVARTEFNDATQANTSVGFSGTDWSVIGSVGAGVSYFVANNISVDFETKFLLGSADVSIGGQAQSATLNTVQVLIGVRLYFPEAKPAPTK